jgi:hypothetical protein|tara:strand:- start:986 stop:1321 length:336 start_codon:yes stop_codon:yes gene_type:complete
MSMSEREVIELLANILAQGARKSAGGFILDEIAAEARREAGRSSKNARISTGRRRGVRGSEQRKAATKRTVSAYQKRFGIEYKKLKKIHPRTSPSSLMKKAHRATKKVMKR